MQRDPADQHLISQPVLDHSGGRRHRVSGERLDAVIAEQISIHFGIPTVPLLRQGLAQNCKMLASIALVLPLGQIGVVRSHLGIGLFTENLALLGRELVELLALII